MAAESTKTVLMTIEWAKRFVRNRPLAIGNVLEPAITSANLIKSVIQGPPFRWRWNRIIQTVTCSPTVQDYPTAVSNFGWIESAAVQDPTTSIWSPLEVKIGLELDSAAARPEFVSAQLDDEEGNITFRMMSVPDKAYIVSLTIQGQDSLLASLNATWGIPDEYMHLYSWGFLALMGLFSGDTTVYQLGNAKFISSLLAGQQGLDQTQVNVFLNNWQAITGTAVANANQLNQGNTSRGI
jgi:hypothetical protein